MGIGCNGNELPQGESSASSITSALTHDTKLVTTDDKKTVIAEFHRAHHFTKKQKARLEVQAAGMDMLDYIVLTFVFVENKRRARETRLKTGHSGGAQ